MTISYQKETSLVNSNSSSDGETKATEKIKYFLTNNCKFHKMENRSKL